MGGTWNIGRKKKRRIDKMNILQAGLGLMDAWDGAGYNKRRRALFRRVLSLFVPLPCEAVGSEKTQRETKPEALATTPHYATHLQQRTYPYSSIR